MQETGPTSGGWRGFFTLFLPGMVGVLSLLLVLGPQVRAAMDTVPQAPPLPVVMAFSLVQPLLLVGLAVWAGNRLAPSLGLRSLLQQRVVYGASLGRAMQPALLRAALIGALVGLAVLALDVLFSGVVSGAPQSLADMQPRSLADTAVGMLYGGITEELLLRWGVMSFFAWIGWRVFQRAQTDPGPWTMWGAIVLSALLFGLGHLPAMAAAVQLTLPIAIRTVLLNALGGIAYGWLFWRDGLEVGMLAHASTHVVFSLVSWLV